MSSPDPATAGSWDAWWAEHGGDPADRTAAAFMAFQAGRKSERRRIRQLAIDEADSPGGKGYGMEPETLWRFADLLGDGDV